MNIPGSGFYGKVGYVEVDLDVKETMAAGATTGTSSSYANTNTEGTVLGVGYSKPLRDSAVSIRFEGTYMELDPVSTSNGVSATGGTVANGGRNQVDASNLEGLNGKVALTFTFGN